MRDLFAGDFVSAQVDNERTHKRIVSYLKKTSPHMIERVHRYKEKEPLFESSGVEKEIASTLDRRVDLPSGGYLVFDYAEAFTVIDVNTGRFVGSRSKNSNQRLEDTITKNNLEAVKEVVRQLRLRDIGGIIVIDFIDMANPKNRASVEDALRQELERDRTKTYVVEISPLGLVEMTRQNVTDGPREILTRKCPTCAGDGIVVSDHTVAMQIERKLRSLAAPGNRVQAYKRRAAPAGARARRRARRLAARRDRGGDPPSLLPRARPRVTSTRITSRSWPRASSSTCSPSRPLVEGSTVELKLGEVGRYDATAAAGKIDGVDVLVADAAKLVGKKANVTIGRVLEGQAFATLVARRPEPAKARSRSRARPRSRRARRPAERPATTPARATSVARRSRRKRPSSTSRDAVDLEDVSLPEGATVAEDADARGARRRIGVGARRDARRRPTERRRRRSALAAARAAAAGGASRPAPEPRPRARSTTTTRSSWPRTRTARSTSPTRSSLPRP